MEQTFKDLDEQQFSNLDIFPGTRWSVLTEPVPNGSIHRLKMKKGTIIPPHTRPSDEFVYIISGTAKTGDRVCEKELFGKLLQESGKVHMRQLQI